MIISINQLDIWEIPLSFADTLSILSKDELERYNKFVFAKHKRRFALARIALRKILSQYIKIPAQDIYSQQFDFQQSAKNIKFYYSDYGKPFLHAQHNIQFNLSHSKDLAILAITKNHAIGVDIEYFSPRPYLGIAKHLFSNEEINALTNLPPSLTSLAFFAIWAQKEAIMKAVGLGLSYPTKEITLSLIPQKPYLIKDPYTNQIWKMAHFMPYPGVSAAVCYHPSLTQGRYFIYDFAEPKCDFTEFKIL